MILCITFVFTILFKMKRLFLFVFLISISLLNACKKEVNLPIYKLNGPVFGTTYHITYLENTVNYQKSIDSLFNLVNTSLSTYIPTSDISKINQGDTTVVVDDLFLEVFQKSKRIYKETDGFFDPTVGNLVNAWGFGPTKEQFDLDTLEVKRQLQYVGLDKVRIQNRKIIKASSKMYLDFNSIAKGYGIDVVGRFLESKNIQNYLIEIGGEIRARGRSHKKTPWRIAIEKPNTDGSQSYQKIIELENQSMATSGNYRKFRLTKNGNKVVHTVNPKTGFASESNLLSVSVIANLDCADVDAYATAFMAMGLGKTKEFLKNYQEIKVFLIFVNSKGELSEYLSR